MAFSFSSLMNLFISLIHKMTQLGLKSFTLEPLDRTLIVLLFVLCVCVTGELPSLQMIIR